MNNIAKINTKLPALAMSDDELMSVLRSSLYVGAQDASIKMAVNYCKAAGLDIMQKPVHLVPMWDSKSGGMHDVVMPGIGLYRTQASRSGEMAGIDEPIFGEDITESFEAEDYYDKYDKKNKKRDALKVIYPKWCKVTVRKLMPNGMVAEYHAKELWKENYATQSKDSEHPNAMWKRRPYAQLAKCAEAQALRKAFPELGAMPTAEEMEGKELDITAQSQAVAEKIYVSDAVFAEQLPKWKKAVEDGKKSVENLIIWIETKGTFLTESQLATINTWQVTPAPQTVENEVKQASDNSDFLSDYSEGEHVAT